MCLGENMYILSKGVTLLFFVFGCSVAHSSEQLLGCWENVTSTGSSLFEFYDVDGEVQGRHFDWTGEKPVLDLQVSGSLIKMTIEYTYGYSCYFDANLLNPNEYEGTVVCGGLNYETKAKKLSCDNPSCDESCMSL